jgi:chaperone modulatory protein CbpM
MIIGKLEFLGLAQLDAATLEVWLEEEWLIPTQRAQELAFSEIDLARARLIRDLTQNMGVNDEGVGVVLNLVDQVHGLRRALAEALRAMPVRSAANDAGPARGEDQAAP